MASTQIKTTRTEKKELSASYNGGIMKNNALTQIEHIILANTHQKKSIYVNKLHRSIMKHMCVCMNVSKRKSIRFNSDPSLVDGALNTRVYGSTAC